MESVVTIRARSSVHPITVTVAPTGWLAAHRDGGGHLVPDAGRIGVAAAELRSGNALIDRETKRRIDARKFPTVSGEMTELVGADGAVSTLQGMIEFLGESVLVEGDVVLEETDSFISVHGEGTLDVRWWGLQPPKLLTLRVYPEIVVRIDLVLTLSDEGHEGP